MPGESDWAQPSRVAGLVLAAGAGRRYGMPKALVPYQGSLLVERAYRFVAAFCDPVFVVLGAAADEIESRADLGHAVLLRNPEWDTGMASSLRTGLAALTALPDELRGPEAVDAVLVHLVDLPGITAAAIRRVASYVTRDVLAVATYDGVRGHPVLLGHSHWVGAAESAVGDQGARRYLAAHEVTEIACGDVADPTDLDYPPS